MSLHTFVVLAYGDSPYLAECLDSLKNQHQPGEIIITTSTPNARISEMSEKYGLTLLTTEGGQGIAHDWNFGLHSARTKYVTLAHQDDLYLPDYVSDCIRSAERFDDTLICFPDYAEIAGQKERSGTPMLTIKRLIIRFFMPLRPHLAGRYWKTRFLSFGCPVAAPGVMYNMEKLSDFRFSGEFRTNMDWDAWARMADTKGRFVYVPGILLKHRIHEDSATTKGLGDRHRQEEDLRMFRRFWPEFLAKFLSRIYALSYRSNRLD